jgi:hypothetical protein
MRQPCKFKITDVTRAAKAVLAAGIEIKRIEIDKDGKIMVVAGSPCEGDNGEAPNPWDEVNHAADKERPA